MWHASVVISLWMAPHALAGSASSLMDLSRDGGLLACSNRDSGTVTVVATPAASGGELRAVREIPVGRHPECVSFLGGSHRLAVTSYDEDSVTLLDADSGDVLWRVDVFDEPYGVVSSADGTRLYVSLEYPGQVLELDAATGKTLREIPAGSFPRGLALTSDGTRLLVCEYLSTKVLAIDLTSGKIVREWPAASTDNLARQIIVHPTRPKAYLAHIRSLITAHQGSGSIFPYVTIVDLKPATDSDDGHRTRIPMDSFLRNLATANPWEVAISPDGRRFFVVFAGTDEMFACDVVDDDYREIENPRRVALGRNPRAAIVSPDSRTVYVYNALSFDVTAFDVTTSEQVGRVEVTKNPLSPDVLLGKVLFYSALQPMTGPRWISCSSCHPDGQPDGRTWHNPEGLRNTPTLHGLAWTHPQHWSADRDETQDFEHTIRGRLMEGRGLVRGPINPSLGRPNRGLSRELDALAAYTNSHQFTLSPHAKHGLSDSAQRGQAIFLSTKSRCAECHSGPFYTDSQSGKKSRKHNVGTGDSDRSETLGPEYDTPTLLALYRTAPYLHHGQAETLKDVLTTANPDDRHGVTSHLSGGEIDDLIEFLKSLPFEAPEPAAREAGLVPVVN